MKERGLLDGDPGLKTYRAPPTADRQHLHTIKVVGKVTDTEIRENSVRVCVCVCVLLCVTFVCLCVCFDICVSTCCTSIGVKWNDYMT